VAPNEIGIGELVGGRVEVYHNFERIPQWKIDAFIIDYLKNNFEIK